MAYGDVLLFTVGYTASDGGSTRPNYPIKKKYKQIVQTNNPVFPSSYEEVSAQEYWLPFVGLSTTDFNYIPYTAGDEYGWSDNDEDRAKEIPYSSPKRTKYEDFPVNHRIVFANEIYVATRYTFEWTATNFEYDKNPYRLSSVRKWRKLNDTQDAWTQYWYHPLLKRFGLLADITELTELPDFDEPEQSRWDKFIGDATDLNLKNFTFAQIQELVSRGNSLDAAKSTVSSIEKNVLAPTSRNTQVTIQAVQGAQFTLSNPNIGQNGELGINSQTYPAMVQRTLDANTGLQKGIRRYEFVLRPNNINYSNIGVNWSEIDRVYNYPFLDYKNNKLMKISFEFVVESRTNSIASSLYESCEDQLKLLVEMANKAELVYFTDFDSLFGTQIDANTNSNTGKNWAITDLAINSVQRSPGIPRGEITRATVSITVQEARLNNNNAIFMPKLTKTPIPPNRPPTTPGDRACYNLFSVLAQNDVQKLLAECT